MYHPTDEVGLNYINLFFIPGMNVDRKGLIVSYKVLLADFTFWISFDSLRHTVNKN